MGIDDGYVDSLRPLLRERARLYEVVLLVGDPAGIESIDDGSLLVDLWDELVMPRRVGEVWRSLIDGVVQTDG